MEVERKIEGKLTADEVKQILSRHICSELSLINPPDIVFSLDYDCDRNGEIMNCKFLGVKFVSIEK